MKQTLLASISAIALIAGSPLAFAQQDPSPRNPALENGALPPASSFHEPNKKPDTQSGTTGQGAAGSAAAAHNLTSEQRNLLVTSVRQIDVAPVTDADISVAVGAAVPRTVELHPLPSSVIEVYPEWRPYRFIVVGDDILIVEPEDYRVLAVVE
jgi:hypothetical protein